VLLPAIFGNTLPDIYYLVQTFTLKVNFIFRKSFKLVIINHLIEMHLLETENVGDLNGLLEILEDIGKTVDIATLDDSLDEERTMLLNLLNDAEGLGFIEVTNGDVALTELGRQYLKSDVDGRKKLLREELVKIEPFNSIMSAIREKQVMNMEDLENLTSELFPSDSPESTLKVLMNWGRYARILDYDSDEDEVRIVP
jgi:NitT/TauT family transport system ATP-binding protein